MEKVLSANFAAETKKFNEKRKENIKSTSTALLAATVPYLASLPIGSVLLKGIIKSNTALTKDEVKLANEGAEKVLNELTNLSKKGVKIVDFKHESSLNRYRHLTKKIRSKIDVEYQVANGLNAFFTPMSNKIYVNKDKMPLAVFHELGHGFNFNNSAFWKSVQKAGVPLGRFAALFTLLPAITKQSKSKDGEELTKVQKADNFTRNASPVLATVLSLAGAAEEVKATLRGNDWAKEVLSPDLAKKVAKSNKFGLATYVLSAFTMGACAFVAKKVKDNSDHKKEQV